MYWKGKQKKHQVCRLNPVQSFPFSAGSFATPAVSDALELIGTVFSARVSTDIKPQAGLMHAINIFLEIELPKNYDRHVC